MKKGWQTKTLGEICDIERGGSPRPIKNFITTEPNGINWIKIGDATASGKYIYKTEEKIKPVGVKRSRMVYEGDFILSNSMSFGRPYIMKTTGCIHDGWLVLHQPKVDPDYLYHALSSDLVFEQFDRLAAGSTVRNLNIGLAKSVEIPYPPLPEQRRIVAILDEAFAGIATAKANAEKNLQNARAIFESHLQSVFTQRGEGWVETKLDDVTDLITCGVAKRPEYVPQGIPFLSAKNVKCGRIVWSGHQYVSEETHRALTKINKPKIGDILYTRVGSYGEAAIIDRDVEFSIFVSLTLIKPKAVVFNSFLKHYLNSSAVKALATDSISGSGVGNLNVGTVRKFPIHLPSVLEQRSIVAMLDDLRIGTQRLEALYQRKLAALEVLKKSLLNQAFAGEL